ncbi:MAG: hypothetical protein ACLU6Y_16145 [Ruminococcus sp.]
MKADPQNATVKAALSTDGKEEIKYFRVAGEKDAQAQKYHITVPAPSKAEARTEGYYLTIQCTYNQRLFCYKQSVKLWNLFP